MPDPITSQNGGARYFRFHVYFANLFSMRIPIVYCQRFEINNIFVMACVVNISLILTFFHIMSDIQWLVLLCPRLTSAIVMSAIYVFNFYRSILNILCALKSEITCYFSIVIFLIKAKNRQTYRSRSCLHLASTPSKSQEMCEFHV